MERIQISQVRHWLQN